MALHGEEQEATAGSGGGGLLQILQQLMSVGGGIAGLGQGGPAGAGATAGGGFSPAGEGAPQAPVAQAIATGQIPIPGGEAGAPEATPPPPDPAQPVAGGLDQDILRKRLLDEEARASGF